MSREAALDIVQERVDFLLLPLLFMKDDLVGQGRKSHINLIINNKNQQHDNFNTCIVLSNILISGGERGTIHVMVIEGRGIGPGILSIQFCAYILFTIITTGPYMSFAQYSTMRHYSKFHAIIPFILVFFLSALFDHKFHNSYTHKNFNCS